MTTPRTPLFSIKGGGATAAKNETDLFADATATLEDLEKDLHPNTTVTKLGLPTTWSNADGAVNIPGPHTQVVSPTAHEIASFQVAPRAVCGHCKYFDLENGRKEMIKQRFGERLVRDQKWKLKHLGGPVDAIGLCGASGGEMAVTFVSKGCDQFRPRK